jgi:hypothetical protein
MSEKEYAWVMLKEYDPKKGNVRERYRMPEHSGWKGRLFEPEKVHMLDLVAGQWLYDNVRQLSGVGSEKSPRAFHIWYSAKEAKIGRHELKLAKLGRVHKRGEGPSDAPPVLDEATLTSIGEFDPDHELDLPAEIHEEPKEMPVNLSEVDVETGYDDLDPGDPAPVESEKPKKTRKKPGPKLGSKRKPRVKK